jgi:hypothetical protein
MSNLYNLLTPFTAAATSWRVDIFVKKVAIESTGSWLKSKPQSFPILDPFANAVAMCLEVDGNSLVVKLIIISLMKP